MRMKTYMEIIHDLSMHRARRNTAKIDAFVRDTARAKREYALLGARLLLLELPEQSPVPAERLERYAQQYIVAAAGKIFNNCVYIAHDAVAAGAATGSLYTPRGTHDFVGWRNHCINYDELEDGTVVGFDLTAGANVSHCGEPFDVLAVRDLDVPSLQASIGTLFGGDWSLQTPLD